jgi:hypothetical protein
LFESQPAASHTQRHRNDEPDNDNYKHSSERHCARSPATPHEQVEEEEDGEDETRKRKRRADEAEFPGLAVKELVSPGRHIATHEAEKSIKDNDDSAKGAAVARREETKKSECCSNISVVLSEGTHL